jgi:hypothetical protein
MEAEAQPSANEYFHPYTNMLVRLKASRGDLQAALEESARLVKKYPRDALLAINRIIILLQTGHHEEIRQLCHELLHFVDYPLYKVYAAKLAMLLPVDGADFDRACEWADATAASTDLELFGAEITTKAQLARALAEYRRGHFESAYDLAKRTTSDDSVSKYHAAEAWIIQAMACASRQQSDLARDAFAKGDKLLNEPHVDFIATDDGGGGTGEWTIAELLRREAAELLGIFEPKPESTSAHPTEEPAKTDNSTTTSPPTTKD